MSAEELVLPRHARCGPFVSSLERTQSSVKLFTSLKLAELRIPHEASVIIRPRHLLSHFALSTYGLLAPLAQW